MANKEIPTDCQDCTYLKRGCEVLEPEDFRGNRINGTMSCVHYVCYVTGVGAIKRALKYLEEEEVKLTDGQIVWVKPFGSSDKPTLKPDDFEMLFPGEVARDEYANIREHMIYTSRDPEISRRRIRYVGKDGSIYSTCRDGSIKRVSRPTPPVTRFISGTFNY